MNTITLTPNWRNLGNLKYDRGEMSPVVNLSEAVTDRMIENETMFYGADLDFCSKHGNHLTMSFLNFLDSIGIDGVGTNVIIDSRSHMLMPNWYPCIPGWHVDECPRDKITNRPCPEQIANSPVTHILAVVGNTSFTQFVNDPMKLPLVSDEGEHLYKTWTKRLNQKVLTGEVSTTSIKSGEVFSFGVGDLHRGVPASRRGWRWLIRASVGSKRSVENKIRKQAQVYMEDVEQGW